MTTYTKQRKLSQDSLLAGIGGWSVFALLAILLVATLVGGVSYGELLTSIGSFTTGNLDGVPTGSGENLMSVVLTVLAVILLTIGAAAISSMVVNRKVKSYASEELDKILQKGPWFLFLVVLLEELFARWLFLGVIAKLLGGTPVAFYACFIVGNALWALIHMGNFKNKEERSPLRVIPQIIGGIAFTYIFVRYGFWVALMAHYLYNLVLLASKKKQWPGRVDRYRFGYYLAVVVIGWILASAAGVNILSIGPWLKGQLVPLDSFGFWQYAILLVLIGGIVDVIAEFLGLDVARGDDSTIQIMSSLLGLMLVVVFFTTVILGGNWLLSHVVDDPLSRALILTVLMSLTSTAKSGSAIARTTLVNLPSTYFTVVAFTVLGFWPAVGLSVILIVVNYVPTILNSLARE